MHGIFYSHITEIKNISRSLSDYRKQNKIYKRTLTTDEKKYILNCNQRIIDLVKYLENNLEKIPRGENEKTRFIKLKIEIEKQLNYIKERRNLIKELINEITIMERNL